MEPSLLCPNCREEYLSFQGRTLKQSCEVCHWVEDQPLEEQRPIYYHQLMLDGHFGLVAVQFSPVSRVALNEARLLREQALVIPYNYPMGAGPFHNLTLAEVYGERGQQSDTATVPPHGRG